MALSKSNNRRVLLVEDEDDVRRSLQLLLRSHGYDVLAHARASGLARDAAALQSACIVVDLVMPGTGALELLKDMREAGWTGKSVLISGYPIEDWRDDAEKAGFDANLSKPIASSILFRTIERLLHA